MSKDFAVIFDLDGTLLNTDLLIHKSFEYVFHQYKPEYQLTKEEQLSFLGPPLRASFERYFPKEMIDELVTCYRDYNHSHHEDYVTMYPTVKETLQTLKEIGYPLAVVTTKFSEAAYIGLDLFHITKYFDVVLGNEHVSKQKPDPEGIVTAMKQLGCHQAVMIGDNVSDIMAGKNAKVYTIGVNWTPKGTKEIEAIHPDLMIDQMDEIIAFVERMS